MRAVQVVSSQATPLRRPRVVVEWAVADSTELLIEGAIAAGLGLFIGLEREHSELTGTPDPDDPPAGERSSAAAPGGVILGVRSFALLALLGWAAALLGERQTWLPIAGLVVTGGLIAAQYLRADAGHGLTTELAAVLTYLLGMMVHHDRRIALALGLVTTLLLLAKPWTRTLVPKLRRVELTAALQLGIGLAVLLPLLPTEARDPWGVLSPRKIGLFVLLIAGLGFVGYVLHRVLGQTKGAGLAGLVGGLVSSTAVTAAMAQDAARRPEHRLSGQLATFLANAVMPIRVLVVTALL
ncbi:MAG: MgtC/SapB family protein, partial [Deltaproteobacteria bacterium]|nr:MgtC/SapB family protein [Deltaproteobacteria bacterium]